MGEARDGAEALRLCGELRPDLVLMDVRMPTLDGIAATRALKAEFPAVAVDRGHHLRESRLPAPGAARGAAGYVLKDATQQQLVTAIRQLLRQEFLPHPGVMNELLGRAAEPPARRAPLPRAADPARGGGAAPAGPEGRKNREIAAELRVAVGTVKVHIEHILAKLAVSDRTQAAVRALELGLVAPTWG